MNAKFRIWDGQKFLDQKGNHLSLEGKNTIFSYENGGLKIIQKYPKEKIQQWTGALDKNQAKIFSGDIVLWDTEDPFDCAPLEAKKVVGWNQRRMQFRLYNHPTEIGQSGGEEFLAEDVIVIGNIFDWKNEECRYLLDESVKNNP